MRRQLVCITPAIVVISLIAAVAALTRADDPAPSASSNCLKDRVPPGAAVPSPLTFSSEFERVVVVRMTYGTDLLAGLEEAVEREGIRNAVILSGIGSLRGYHIHVVSNTTLPSSNVFFKDQGPQDLTAVNGYIINGRIHAHITFGNERQALAGHLEPGTETFTFAIVTLGVFPDDVDLEGLDDKNWR